MQSAPFLQSSRSSVGIFALTLFSLMPLVIYQIIVFGLFKLIDFILASLLGFILDVAVAKLRKKPLFSLEILSSQIAIFILVIALPPQVPIWIMVLTVSFALMLGKYLYGGLGANPFNPAMVGYAFFVLSFPSYPNFSIDQARLSTLDFLQVFQHKLNITQAEGITQATNLAVIKSETALVSPDYILILLCVFAFLCLSFTKIINYKIPIALVLTTWLWSWLFQQINHQNIPLHVETLHFTTLFVALYIITEPVTQGIHRLTPWIGVILGGFLMVAVRYSSNNIDATAFVILLINAITPLIDKVLYSIKGTQFNQS